MATKINDGGAAFPVTPENEVRMNGTAGKGMTLRDYFAAKAMQAQMTAFWAMETSHGWTDIEIAREAYRLADAMLNARQA